LKVTRCPAKVTVVVCLLLLLVQVLSRTMSPRPEALLDALMKLQNNVVSKEPLFTGGILKNHKQPQPDRLAGQRVS
ncbi:MAG: hypothetical protein ACO3OK_13635, partial [Limisphaerales bacterium]